VTGNSDILGQIGMILASVAVAGVAGMFAVRYYRTKVQYRPVHEDGIEVL